MPPTFVKHTFTTISSGVGGPSAGSATEVLSGSRRSRVTWATSPRPAEAPRVGQNLGWRTTVTRTPRLAGFAEAEQGTRGR